MKMMPDPRPARFGKMSSHQRAEQKRRKILDWVYRWGFSTGPMLTRICEVEQSVAGKLVKHKLLRQTMTESGGLGGVPRYIYTLTEKGLEEATRHAPELLPYPELDPYRVNQQKIRHDMIAQSYTFFLRDTCIDMADFQTERMQIAALGDQRGAKRPDVVILFDDGDKLGIEVELSAKFDRRLDQFADQILRDVVGVASGGSPSFHSYIILTDSAAIAARYTAAFSPGGDVQHWEKDGHGKWVQSHRVQIPNYEKDKIKVVRLD